MDYSKAVEISNDINFLKDALELCLIVIGLLKDEDKIVEMKIIIKVLQQKIESQTNS